MNTGSLDPRRDLTTHKDSVAKKINISWFISVCNYGEMGFLRNMKRICSSIADNKEERGVIKMIGSIGDTNLSEG